MWSLNSFKGRVFYWAKNQQAFWYATAGSYQGVMAKFDCATQLQTGGTLVQMVTWTLDAGNGVDDLAVFIFSTGEVLVYKGSDPGSATDWNLIGRFQIGEPLGPRGHAKVGGTEIILTRDGYVDISAALRDGRYSEETAYSAKIIRASKDAANAYSAFDGWEATLYPGGQLFIVNVPTGTATAIQHARETSSGGWCEFNGWDALAFCVFKGRLYFGNAAGQVCLADEGAMDGANYIDCWGIPAFNSLGSRANRKQVTATTVSSSFSRPSSYTYDGLADFDLTLRSTVQDDAIVGGSLWDVVSWDTATWESGGQVSANPITRHGWKQCHAIGYAVTVSVRLRQRSQIVNWYTTSIQYRKAGVF